MKSKLLLIFIIVFSISQLCDAKGIPMSTQSDTNTYSWIKGRQVVSVNLVPGYACLFPTLINTIFDNANTFAGLVGTDLSSIEKYMNAIEYKGSFWYVPSISYTLLVHPRVGIEVGFGVQSMSFLLNIPKDKAGDLINSAVSGGNLGNIGDAVSTDTKFKASFTYLPATIGIKFLGGKNRQVVNTFRFGLETLISDVETENGITGVKTKRHTVDTTMYVSYELGWTIELFPTREWPVKPYIDFSLFEIGYYVRSGIPGIYEDVREGIGFFGSGLINVNTIIPSWSSFPSWANYVASIKFALFPRIGFSLRF